MYSLGLLPLYIIIIIFFIEFLILFKSYIYLVFYNQDPMNLIVIAQNF